MPAPEQSENMAAAVPGCVQLVAEALAAALAQSTASSACTQALQRLIPGLRFLCLAVANRRVDSQTSDSSNLVAAANYAAEGPTTLHLLDPCHSAVGLALKNNRPLTARLHEASGSGDGSGGGSTGAAIAALPDVQLLLAEAPAARHLLCIPFGGNATTTPSSSGSAQSGRQQAAQQRGALLLGLAGPGLGARQLTLLRLLAGCLPLALGRLALDTLEFVDFACGSSATSGSAASCCCCEPGEDEELQGQGCREAGSEGRGSDGSGAQAVRVPRACASCSNGGGPPSRHAQKPALLPAEAASSLPRGGGRPTQLQKAEAPARFVAAAAGAAAACGASGAGSLSKAIISAASAGGADELLRQSRLSLRFVCGDCEAEYSQWVVPQLLASDRIACLVTLAALLIMRSCQAFPHLSGPAAITGMAACGALLVLFLLSGYVLSKQAYSVWRVRYVVVLRLCAVAFVTVPTHKSWTDSASTAAKECSWGLLWQLSTAETLFASALGFRLPQWQDPPLHVAAIGVAAAHLRHSCAKALQCPSSSCFSTGVVLAAVLGCLLPSLVLRRMERHSRAAFSRQFRAAAAAF